MLNYAYFTNNIIRAFCAKEGVFMRKLKKSQLFLTLVLALTMLGSTLALTACPKPVQEPWMPNDIEVNVSSDSLYVEKVKNLPESFIMGMDASMVD